MKHGDRIDSKVDTRPVHVRNKNILAEVDGEPDHFPFAGSQHDFPVTGFQASFHFESRRLMFVISGSKNLKTNICGFDVFRKSEIKTDDYFVAIHQWFPEL